MRGRRASGSSTRASSSRHADFIPRRYAGFYYWMHWYSTVHHARHRPRLPRPLHGPLARAGARRERRLAGEATQRAWPAWPWDWEQGRERPISVTEDTSKTGGQRNARPRGSYGLSSHFMRNSIRRFLALSNSITISFPISRSTPYRRAVRAHSRRHAPRARRSRARGGVPSRLPRRGAAHSCVIRHNSSLNRSLSVTARAPTDAHIPLCRRYCVVTSKTPLTHHIATSAPVHAAGSCRCRAQRAHDPTYLPHPPPPTFLVPITPNSTPAQLTPPRRFTRLASERASWPS